MLNKPNSLSVCLHIVQSSLELPLLQDVHVFLVLGSPNWTQFPTVDSHMLKRGLSGPSLQSCFLCPPSAQALVRCGTDYSIAGQDFIFAFAKLHKLPAS